jgi:peptidoglycan hydrolase-like protein with peptidoglycan-binding domain
MSRPYLQAGLSLSSAGPVEPELVRALQRDLRALGYKAAGINGTFDASTERAARNARRRR